MEKINGNGTRMVSDIFTTSFSIVSVFSALCFM